MQYSRSGQRSVVTASRLSTYFSLLNIVTAWTTRLHRSACDDDNRQTMTASNLVRVSATRSSRRTFSLVNGFRPCPASRQYA